MSLRPQIERLRHPGWCLNLVEVGGLEAGEQVLVVVDEPLLEEGAQLAATVQDAGGRPRLELWAGWRPLEHPPRPILDAADQSSLAYFLSEEPLAEEAAARLELGERLSSHHGREIFMGFVDSELLRGELSDPVPDLSEPADRVLAAVRDAEHVRVRGAAGSDLSLRVGGRPWLTDIGRLLPGRMANFPGGEVYVAPYEDSAVGVLVADLTVPYTVEGLVDEPVTLRFDGGRVISIEGGEAARLLRRLVNEAGEGADVVAELGIGLNPAVRPRGHIMLDEKAAGTAHVAIGRNTGQYGGVNEATIHVDCVFSAPELEADGRSVELRP
ncbi:MAG: aminopeptidase [Actinomycetota bacterium]|nr:aminopeptidase [Actinomycetota bacterium]